LSGVRLNQWWVPLVEFSAGGAVVIGLVAPLAALGLLVIILIASADVALLHDRRSRLRSMAPRFMRTAFMHGLQVYSFLSSINEENAFPQWRQGGYGRLTIRLFRRSQGSPYTTMPGGNMQLAINAGARHGRRRVISAGAACMILLAAGGAFYWFGPANSNSGVTPRAANRPAVPVTFAVATRRDIPIYLTGLGTVQAMFSIDIQAQVDGQLQQVLFTEGQQVKKGDVLAKIDSRPFQAAFDQAKAKRAQRRGRLGN
jgi:hypothetical protein